MKKKEFKTESKKLMDFDNENEFTFTLTKENLYPYDAEKNPTGLNLIEWFANYSKEAKLF